MYTNTKKKNNKKKNKQINMLSNLIYPYSLILLPFIFVNTTYYFVKRLGCGNFRRDISPIPSYVFSVVWSILLPLIGFSWFLARKGGKQFHILFSLLTICLSVYIPLSLCIGLNDLALLLFLRIFTIYILFVLYTSRKWKSLWALLPLLLWISIVKLTIIVTLLNLFS